MNLKCFVEVSDNVNLDEYLALYNYVRDNMEHPEWLGTFTRDEIEKILKIGGKIWMYYDGNIPVCSVFYIPSSNKSLRKYNIKYDESITGSLGPIMVRKEYIGNDLQTAMMGVLNNYVKGIGKIHMFTKAHSDNIYSIRNILKDGYRAIYEYENELGAMTVFVK